jgi:hypothetical protein
LNPNKEIRQVSQNTQFFYFDFFFFTIKKKNYNTNLTKLIFYIKFSVWRKSWFL